MACLGTDYSAHLYLHSFWHCGDGERAKNGGLSSRGMRDRKCLPLDQKGQLARVHEDDLPKQLLYPLQTFGYY